jgi:hypothetical protein
MVVGLDNEKDADRVTHHLEQQTVVVELNLWEKGGSLATL